MKKKLIGGLLAAAMLLALAGCGIGQAESPAGTPGGNGAKGNESSAAAPTESSLGNGTDTHESYTDPDEESRRRNAFL